MEPNAFEVDLELERLAAPTHDLERTSSGHSNVTTPSVTAYSNMMTELVGATARGARNVARSVGEPMACLPGAIQAGGNAIIAGTPSVARSLQPRLSLDPTVPYLYDTNSKLFDEWLKAPEHDYQAMEKNFNDNWVKFDTNMKEYRSGIREKELSIHDSNLRLNNMAAARMLLKREVEKADVEKGELEIALQTEESESQQYQTKKYIMDDVKSGKLELYKILEREGLTTEEAWAKKGQKGLPGLARKLVRLGYHKNKKCPVHTISKDRRMVNGLKEDTEKYKEYLQYVLGYRKTASAELVELLETGNFSEKRKRKMLEVMRADDTDTEDDEEDEPMNKKPRANSSS